MAVNARAAELRWSGPEECAWSSQVTEQVEAQIGGTLAAVEGIDFEIAVSRENSGKWRLTLVSVERASGERRKRELSGESCGEVANAAAVALAMAIREKTEESTMEAEPPPAATPVVRPPRAPRSKIAASTPRSAPASSVTPTVTVGAVLDVGALPNPALGAELEAGIAWRALYAGAEGAVFSPNQLDGPDGRGGDFQLWAAGVVACLGRPAAGLSAVVCAGYEIGALSGRGTGVTDPRSETTTWQALRAELGVVVPFGAGFSGVLRGGAVVPLQRREFVLDSELVHRPAAVGARFLAGIRVDF
jgi:hypothetical protein